MRFVPITLALTLILLSHSTDVSAQVQNGKTLTRAKEASAVAPQSARRMPRTHKADPETMTGLYTTQIITNLGSISALAQDEDGTIYTLDSSLGRLYALPDRGKDGTPDGRRLFMDEFEAPTGLAYANGTLYVADAQAVWAVDRKTRARKQITTLQNLSLIHI